MFRGLKTELKSAAIRQFPGGTHILPKWSVVSQWNKRKSKVWNGINWNGIKMISL